MIKREMTRTVSSIVKNLKQPVLLRKKRGGDQRAMTGLVAGNTKSGLAAEIEKGKIDQGVEIENIRIGLEAESVIGSIDPGAERDDIDIVRVEMRVVERDLQAVLRVRKEIDQRVETENASIDLVAGIASTNAGHEAVIGTESKVGTAVKIGVEVTDPDHLMRRRETVAGLKKGVGHVEVALRNQDQVGEQ